MWCTDHFNLLIVGKHDSLQMFHAGSHSSRPDFDRPKFIGESAGLISLINWYQQGRLRSFSYRILNENRDLTLIPSPLLSCEKYASVNEFITQRNSFYFVVTLSNIWVKCFLEVEHLLDLFSWLGMQRMVRDTDTKSLTCWWQKPSFNKYARNHSWELLVPPAVCCFCAAPTVIQRGGGTGRAFTSSIYFKDDETADSLPARKTGKVRGGRMMKNLYLGFILTWYEVIT